ncbi:MAG: serine/threonine-protein kinase [Myxococcota bacterium]
MKLVRHIDRGGFGIVDEVEGVNGERWAKKTFKPQIGNDDEKARLRRRFEREVRIQSQIHHPNVMPVLESDLSTEPPWFLMPLADRSYEAQIVDDRNSGAIDPGPWTDILAGVEELHRLGYVHRDLKPANVLLLDDRWVLSDFGLVLPTMRDTTVLTGTASAYGSRAYAAPEQAVDFRNTPEQADIFALGCILQDGVAPSPARIPFAQATCDGPYGPVIEKCTEQDPNRRFQSIAALRAVLFDVWRTASFTSPSDSIEELIGELQANASSLEAWSAIATALDRSEPLDRDAVLRAINEDLVSELHQIDTVLFGRVVRHICHWASKSEFAFSYCDVIGDRLFAIYRISNTRFRCAVVLAALELSVSHNRWHVMNQVGRMLDDNADSALAERMVIELTNDTQLCEKLGRIESAISWSRAKWHTRIRGLLNSVLDD